VHLHSSWATALSCLKNLDPDNALPPITPYVVMRVGRVPVVPYMRPGSPAMREPVFAAARDHAAVLLANHGPVVAAPSFEAAVFAAEEVEEAAKLFFITRGMATNALSADQITELESCFRLR
jgi:ribulose-5-phosphate 4-epimerase/fuculose-1-phosphate aldolase